MSEPRTCDSAGAALTAMATRQPVVTGGTLATTGDTWVLRMGGTGERCEAWAAVGGMLAGRDGPVPPPDRLGFGMVGSDSPGGRHRCVLYTVTSPDVARIRLEDPDGTVALVVPVHVHPDPAAAVFLIDVHDQVLHSAAALDADGEVLAVTDLTAFDTGPPPRVVGPDNHLERGPRP